MNNKPTKVLSWVGPPARYFPETEYYDYGAQRSYSYSTFEKAIYQGGEIFAIAPANVLGAVVARDSKGFDWLIVVCAEGNADVVYRRPYKKSSSATLYDPVNAPDGWKKIGTSSLTDGDPAGSFTQAADIPWFFNGSGTEAQTMRRWWSGGIHWPYGLLKRLKLEITNDVNDAKFTIVDRGDQGFVEERTCSASYDQYGAGSGQYSSRSRGEYTFAADYKDATPVLAKIRVEGESSSQAMVSVSHNHEPDQHYKDVLTGETREDASHYREYLVWDTGGSRTELLTFSDTYAPYTISWMSGATTSYNRTIDRRTIGHETTYFIDLRRDQYAYYFWVLADHDEIAGGAERSTQDGNEGSVLTQSGSSETLHTNTFPHYEGDRSYYRRSYEIRCSGSNNGVFRSYGTANFGWWSWYGQALGNAPFDLDGYRAHSQRLLADFSYDVVGTANKLSGGSFEAVIPGAPSSGTLYYPIEVVR